MAKKPPNTLLRVVVPIIMAGVAILVGYSVMRTTTGAPGAGGVNPSAAPAGAQGPSAADAAAGAGGAGDGGGIGGEQDDAAADQSGAADQPAQPEPAAQDPGADGAVAGAGQQPAPMRAGALRARTFPAHTLTPIGAVKADGSVDENSDFRHRLVPSVLGAGIESLTLSHHYQTIRKKEHDRVQGRASRSARIADGSVVTFQGVPMAAVSVTINGARVFLVGSESSPVWRETAPGAFEATIVDDGDNPVARITRRYELAAGSYDVTVHQGVENLTDRPIDVVWTQDGPIDLPGGTAGYGGDKRRLRFGYILDPLRDPTQQTVLSSRHMIEHGSLVKLKESLVWPRPEFRTASNPAPTLVWFGLTSRYFGVALHPQIDPGAAAPAKGFHLAAQVERFVLGNPGAKLNDPDSPVVLTRITSQGIRIAPGESADTSVGMYAGPLSRKIISAEPMLKKLGLDGLVIFTFGGMCAFCTFSWLTGLLHGFLGFLHDYLVHDWALAIIVLVLCVRTALHPVTKFSQTSLQRFTRQMQALAPKQKALQEKYKGDPKKLREEVARLMKEEHVNYAGALGCLPMFLQTPIWIALYAMLYFTFELRHTGAFFGVFQHLFGGWSFLGDLAEPDRLIQFSRGFNVPLLGPVDSLNILPLLLGFVFYVHQKYITPPPSASTTPEMETQQKIMRVMMVVMFPLFMYTAPSGLTLYFITNSLLAIVESRHIRNHVEKLLEEEKNNPKPRRGRAGQTRDGAAKGGFLNRLRTEIEARQAEALKAKQQAQRRGGRKGR